MFKVKKIRRRPTDLEKSQSGKNPEDVLQTSSESSCIVTSVLVTLAAAMVDDQQKCGYRGPLAIERLKIMRCLFIVHSDIECVEF